MTNLQEEIDRYTTEFPDVKQFSLGPVRIYLRLVANEGFNPHHAFTTRSSLMSYPGVCSFWHESIVPLNWIWEAGGKNRISC